MVLFFVIVSTLIYLYSMFELIPCHFPPKVLESFGLSHKLELGKLSNEAFEIEL